MAWNRPSPTPPPQNPKFVGDEAFCLIIRLCYAVSAKRSQWRDGCKQRRLQSIKLPLRACQTHNSWKKLTFQISSANLLLSPTENKWLDGYSLGSFNLSHLLQAIADLIMCVCVIPSTIPPSLTVSLVSPNLQREEAFSKEHARKMAGGIKQVMVMPLWEAFLKNQTDKAERIWSATVQAQQEKWKSQNRMHNWIGALKSTEIPYSVQNV